MASNTNHRSFDREPFAGPPVADLVVMRPDGDGATHKIEPFDLTPRGIGFWFAKPLPIGSLCRFTVTRHGKPGDVTGRVTRCEREPDGRYAIGMKFLVVRRPE